MRLQHFSQWWQMQPRQQYRCQRPTCAWALQLLDPIALASGC
jgi:hypothetical protein